MNLVIYAPEGITRSLPSLRRLLDQRPDGTIIISHLGDPQIKENQLMSGRELLELASEPSIYVLLSGLSMFCDYPYKELDGVTEIIGVNSPEKYVMMIDSCSYEFLTGSKKGKQCNVSCNVMRLQHQCFLFSASTPN